MLFTVSTKLSHTFAPSPMLIDGLAVDRCRRGQEQNQWLYISLDPGNWTSVVLSANKY